MKLPATTETAHPQGDENANPAAEPLLCQVNERVSCGACCGLYNVQAVSRKALAQMLRTRTAQFRTTPRTVEAIFQFKQDVENRELQRRPMPQFHHCPFLGLIGTRRKTVGCLLHPAAHGNNGLDFRSISHYGGMTCHIYFCPSTHLLPRRYKQIIRRVLDDWYLYGLVVTEIRLLKSLFEELEARLNRPLYFEDFASQNACQEALKQLLLLRVSWPFRSPHNRCLAHYFFNDHLYERPIIAPLAPGQTISRYQLILQELETDLQSEHTLRQAELYLDDRFKMVQHVLETALP